MTVYRVSLTRGDDGNIGSEAAPFKSITKAFEVVTHYDAIEVEEGLYLEGDLNPRGVDNVSMRGLGKVIMDSDGHDRCVYSTSTSYGWSVSNFVFKNPDYQFFRSYDDADWYFDNCAFLMTGDKYQSGTTNIARNIGIFASGCLVYGVVNTGIDSLSRAAWRSCVFVGVTTASSDHPYYNCAATNATILAGHDCIDTSVSPPPFTDIITDLDNPDFSYDTGHANYDLYISGGSDGEICGLESGTSTEDSFSAGWPALKYGTQSTYLGLHANIGSEYPKGLGKWENYSHYYNLDWENIDIQAGVNDSFQFNEGTVDVSATIAQGLYASGASFAAAIETAIGNSLAVDIHTVTYEASRRLFWITDGISLEINCSSFSSNDAWSEMGFDTSSDKTGSSGYLSDHGVCGGPDAGAESNAGPIVIDSISGKAYIDKSVEPNATNGDIVSPVISAYYPKEVKSISIGLIKKSANAAIDHSQGTATRTLMIRGSNGIFDLQDPAGSTPLDWTEVEYENFDISSVVTSQLRHWQLRLRLRSNATVLEPQ